MGFSEEFVKNASKEVISKSIKSDYAFIENILKTAVNNAAQATPYFKPEDVLIYLQGSYACHTNSHFQSKMEVVVEVTRTREYSYDVMMRNEFKMRDNFYIDFNHYFDVKRFKDSLAEQLNLLLKQKVVFSDTNLLIPAFGSLQHSVDIFPCFKYKYFTDEGGSMRGKLVYDRHLDDHYLIFTNFHAANGNLKDEITRGNFKRMVRFFKNIMAISLREDGKIHRVRGYYIECLLYNVPTEMFFTADGKLSSVFLKIINWLNFADLDDFICQNQIWGLWGNADGFWNKAAARQFIHDVIEFYEAFPSKRTEVIKTDDTDEHDSKNN